MVETRRKFDQDFKEGALRLVRETGKPIAQIAKDLGIHHGTLGNWVTKDHARQRGDGRLGEDERAELARLRKEIAELAMSSSVRWPSGPDQRDQRSAAGPPQRHISFAPLVKPRRRHPQRAAGHHVRDVVLAPLGGDEPGHGYRPICVRWRQPSSPEDHTF